MKSLLKTATLALVAAISNDSEIATAEKPKTKSAPKANFGRKVMPTKAALKKMSAEKRAYWEDRIEKRKHPMLNKRWVYPHLAGRELAAYVDTRQSRRQEDRRVSKMQLGMSAETWHAARGFGKMSPPNSRRRKAA